LNKVDRLISVMVKIGQRNTITWKAPYVYELFLFLVFIIQTVCSVRYEMRVNKRLNVEYENKELSQKNWFIVSVV
jgi:hypothetical protein